MLLRGLKQLVLVVFPAVLLFLIVANFYRQETIATTVPHSVSSLSNQGSNQDGQPGSSQQHPHLESHNLPPQVHSEFETQSENNDEETPANEHPLEQAPTEEADPASMRVLQEQFIEEIAKNQADQIRKNKGKAAQGDQAPASTESKDETADLIPFDISKTHREISALSTTDGKYFVVDYGDYSAYNTNLIPHPQLNDTWIVIAQQRAENPWPTVWFAQLVCDGYFKDDKMLCRKSPLLLPIASTFTDKCLGDVAYFGWNNGPHDARAFYGPDEPYTMFGSNSAFSCFGLFMQDLRTLVDWGLELFDPAKYRRATELQKPQGFKYGQVEKNWFVFWDKEGQMYTHHDVSPMRVFSKTGKDGTQGEDLAPLAQKSDVKCMQKYMPPTGPVMESIHQATNSLAVTTCKRSDPDCVPSDDNTFIMTIFHWKSFHYFHGVYEPYVLLFRQSAPFEVHAISTKPLWIRGRGKPGEKTGTPKDETRPKEQSEMLYVTSMSWKQKGLRYHGYADDIIFLGFGVEDSKPGIMDVKAGDLLQDLGLCSEI